MAGGTAAVAGSRRDRVHYLRPAPVMAVLAGIAMT